jgi:hypothetical protein
MSKLSRPVSLSDSFYLPISLLIYKIINQILPGMAWYFSILIVVFVVWAVLLIADLLRLVRLDRIQIPYWLAVCIMILGVYIVVRFI